MPTITLRQANPADWTAIATLLKANRLPLDGARDHLPTFVVAESGLEVVGCAGAEPRGDIALLRSVAVAPALHRHGIGKDMVSLLLDEARRRNFKTAYLLTTTAREYFRGFGFEPMERSRAPAALKLSAEFQGACPANAELMALTLQRDQPTGLEHLPVAVLGAGPVGLAAAARLLERGIPYFIVESASSVGANLIDYGHVRLFSPWRYNVDPAMAKWLAATGWQAPPADDIPLADDVVERVLKPFARLPQVASSLRLNTQVLAVTREGFDKVKSAGRERAAFVVRALHNGEVIELKARAVIDSTGTWNHPNPVGASGLPALGEQEAAERIFYGIPDVLGELRHRYAGKTTLVVGAGHSAANALVSLSELARQVPGTRLVWSVRSPVLARVFGGGDADALPARGALGTSLRLLRDSGGLDFRAGLRITRIQKLERQLRVVGVDDTDHEQQIEHIDEIICATGQRPDLSITGELRVKLDPWLESNEALGPLVDPNLHSCGTVRPHGHRELGHPEPGLYTVGVKSYGRAPTFLMATGFEQVRSVVAAIAGDMAAADRVELVLPETGVCNATASVAAAPADSTCCGGPPKSNAAACCALDEQKKSEGSDGCGCGITQRSAVRPARTQSACC